LDKSNIIGGEADDKRSQRKRKAPGFFEASVADFMWKALFEPDSMNRKKKPKSEDESLHLLMSGVAIDGTPAAHSAVSNLSGIPIEVPVQRSQGNFCLLNFQIVQEAGGHLVVAALPGNVSHQLSQSSNTRKCVSNVFRSCKRVKDSRSKRQKEKKKEKGPKQTKKSCSWCVCFSSVMNPLFSIHFFCERVETQITKAIPRIKVH
jgi:hypothetical protein